METKNNRVISSFSLSPQLQEQLREYRKENGVSVSWLINTILNEYFEKLRGERNGEQ